MQRLVQHLRITAIMDDERELRRPDRSTCRVDPVDTARSHVHDRAAVCVQDVKSDRVAPDRRHSILSPRRDIAVPTEHDQITVV
jgi:hypothetical protein